MTIAEFIAKYHLSMTAAPVGNNPHMDGDNNMDNWLCEFPAGAGAPLEIYFSMGRGHGGKAPEIAEVLDCLASDAAGYEDARNFEDWAGEYGYDPDSRKAERTYNAIKDQSEKLKEFFGEAAYQELLEDVERL